MNPHQLELFYYVAKAKGVSRAARQMPYGIQQPSVSSQVNALERSLGVSLFERRPFKLTPAGEELFRFVEPFFGRFDQVREKLQGAAQLRFGTSPLILRDYFGPVLEALRSQFPRLSMILRGSNQPELIEALERDELDLVISIIPENLSPALGCIELTQLRLVLLVPRMSRVRSAKDLWRGAQVSEPLICLPPNESICQCFQRALAQRGLTWVPSIEMDSLDMIERYAAAGYGIGLSLEMPERKLPSKVRLLELEGFPSVALGLLYRTHFSGNQELRQAFIERVKQEARAFFARTQHPVAT